MKLVGTIRSLSLQMAFAQRFNEVTCDITHISSLEENRKYPIERAELRPDSARRSCSVSETSRRIVCARCSSPNVTPPNSRTTMYWPSMTGSPSGIWFRRVDVPIRTRTNWLLNRLVCCFSGGFALGQTQRPDSRISSLGHVDTTRKIQKCFSVYV